MFVSELGVLGYCITQVPILCLAAWSISVEPYISKFSQMPRILIICQYPDYQHQTTPSSCLRSCVFFLHPYKATRAELLDWHSTAGLLFEEAVALVNVDRIFPGTRRLNPCQGAMPTSIPTRLSVPHPCPPAQGLLRICHS